MKSGIGNKVHIISWNCFVVNVIHGDAARARVMSPVWDNVNWSLVFLKHQMLLDLSDNK